MKAICRVCSSECEITPAAARNYVFICRPCSAEVRRKWCAKRKAADLPLGKPDMEYHRAYDAEHAKLPEVRARRAEQARQRWHDPVEGAKARVRCKAREAIKSGKLIRQPCEVCGEVKVDAHHDDYDKALDVRWLCRVHHRQHHAKVRGK